MSKKATKRRSYTQVAERVTAAVTELNAAIMEAFEHPQVRVHLGPADGIVSEPPIQLGCEVTRVTKHAIAPEIAERKMAWTPYRIRYRLADEKAVQTVKAIESVKRARANARGKA